MDKLRLPTMTTKSKRNLTEDPASWIHNQAMRLLFFYFLVRKCRKNRKTRNSKRPTTEQILRCLRLNLIFQRHYNQPRH